MTTQELEDAFTDLIIKHASDDLYIDLVKKFIQEAKQTNHPLSESSVG